MANTLNVLVTGSKEFPMGTNRGDDPLPSGGIEIYIEKLVENLSRDEEIRFIIITRKFSQTKKHEISNNIEIYRVPWIKGFYFRNISFNFFSFLKALRLDFDIIFSQGIFATLFGIFLSKIKNKPIIGVAHGKASSQPQYNILIRKILGLIERFVFSNVDLLLCLSENEKKIFGRYARNVEVIPIGINPDLYYTSDKEKYKEKFGLSGRIVITFIGRLLKVKGVDYLIDALVEVDRDFVCLIVGSGKEEEELKKKVRNKKLDHKIRFLGFRNDIQDILKATDIFVLPSFSEGLCLSLLEAKASGCACIVSDIGLSVKKNVNALVFKPGDKDNLKNLIVKLIDDSDLRKKLSGEARRDVDENYNWDIIVERYSKMFKKFFQK